MCGFIAQLVEHRTGIAEITGSNPVEALIFFRLLLSNCLNWKIYCDDHSSLSFQVIFLDLCNSANIKLHVITCIVVLSTMLEMCEFLLRFYQPSSSSLFNYSFSPLTEFSEVL